jgi:hypothetical protein
MLDLPAGVLVHSDCERIGQEGVSRREDGILKKRFAEAQVAFVGRQAVAR